MQFEMTLEPPPLGVKAVLGAPVYDTDEDAKAGSMLAQICDAFRDVHVRFFVRTGSGGHWPVDVWADLLACIEQLHDAMAALRTGRSPEWGDKAVLHFHDQGLQCKVSLVRNGGLVVVDVRPDIVGIGISEERYALPARVVVDELTQLAEKFVKIAVLVWPALTQDPVFGGWSRDLVNESRALLKALEEEEA